MLSLIKTVLSLLDSGQKKRIAVLQFVFLLLTISELVAVASIGPFMALATDFTKIQASPVLHSIFNTFNFESEKSFVYAAGALVLAMLAISSVIGIVTTWIVSILGAQIGAEMSTKLLKTYITRPWAFHISNSSSGLIKNVATESSRVSTCIIQPMLSLNAKLILVISFSIALALYQPRIMLIALTLFICCYICIYQSVRGILKRNGKNISASLAERFGLITEALNGVKEIKLLGREQYYIDRFSESSRQFSHNQGINLALARAPRFLIELIAFGSVIVLVLFMINHHEGGLITAIPMLSIFALAGAKLLPIMAQIYNELATIRANTPALDAIAEDLKYNHDLSEQHLAKSAPFEDAIEFRDVTFKFHEHGEPALEKVNIKIPKNQVTGFIGGSGAGKTTAIDILMGLTTPTSGDVYIDKKLLHEIPTKSWQKKIGYVSQQQFIVNGSILDNIALGIPKHEIDFSRAKKAARLASLEEFVGDLESGLHRPVGERGKKISGGQAQRLAIARALYHDAELLIFDEATSALDVITEQAIMDSIKGLKGKKTIIIIAHRLSTIKLCDSIYMLEKGKIIAHGSYDKFATHNQIFKAMSAPPH